MVSSSIDKTQTSSTDGVRLNRMPGAPRSSLPREIYATCRVHLTGFTVPSHLQPHSPYSKYRFQDTKRQVDKCIDIEITMSLPMHLRAYREKSKDELSRDFFNVPQQDSTPGPGEPPSVVKIRTRRESNAGKEKEGEKGTQGMDINAVLSVEGKEEVYVSLILVES